MRRPRLHFHVFRQESASADSNRLLSVLVPLVKFFSLVSFPGRRLPTKSCRTVFAAAPCSHLGRFNTSEGTFASRIYLGAKTASQGITASVIGCSQNYAEARSARRSDFYFAGWSYFFNTSRSRNESPNENPSKPPQRLTGRNNYFLAILPLTWSGAIENCYEISESSRKLTSNATKNFWTTSLGSVPLCEERSRLIHGPAIQGAPESAMDVLCIHMYSRMTLSSPHRISCALLGFQGHLRASCPR